MTNGRKTAILFLCMALLWAGNALGQTLPDCDRLVTFESSEIPAWIQAHGGSVQLSSKHFREGKQSLQWNYTNGKSLAFNRNIGFENADPTGKDTYLSTFIAWIYQETPCPGEHILFQFSEKGRLCSHFEMGADFCGWRGVCLSFERDMQGSPSNGMDALQIFPPQNSGTMWIDHIVMASKIDSRYQSADEQAPYVNAGTRNHWLHVLKNSKNIPDIAQTPLTNEQIADIHIIEERFKSLLYRKSNLTPERIQALRDAFAFYEIRRSKDGSICGKPVFMTRFSEWYERMSGDWTKDMIEQAGTDFSEFFDLLEKIAVAYNDATQESIMDELESMFMDMYDFITDLGVVKGSCWGYCHHYGYNIRGLYPAYFLMKEPLLRTGRLEQAQKTMFWYGMSGEIFPKPSVNGVDIDTFNTHTEGRLASILIMEDSPAKVQCLRSYVRWFDYGCRPAPGLSDSFKADGSAYHHANNYPAYAVGGLEGVARTFYCFAGTQFRIPESAHSVVKNVLLTMRFYSNLLQWPLSMSGRHPNGRWHLNPETYAMMALSGTPDGKGAIDPELASAFLRLERHEYKRSTFERECADYLVLKGYEPETEPQGNKSLGYACISAHRRDGWLAVVRGHSRYLWSAEQYLAANWYGRNLGYGAMEILSSPDGSPATLEKSGWVESGYDWNRIPGTTAVHLPFERLRAQVLNVDTFSGHEEMLLSDESFAGGLSFGSKNGNFGLMLHGHDKYDGSLRARKSYHFFDGVIICLGSAIEDSLSEFNTQTTLFQMNVANDSQQQHYARFCQSSPWFTDANGNGYVIDRKSKSDCRYIQAYPQETVNERKKGTSTGNWVTLLLDHGKAPSGSSYAYAVLPAAGEKATKAFSRKPSYRILRQDKVAHIVEDKTDGSISYVLFAKSGNLPGGIVCSADTSCLLMAKKNGAKELEISVSQPDLALYRGPADEIYGPDGKRIERSIYSRPWKYDESKEIEVKIEVRGTWHSRQNSDYLSISHSKCNTTVCVRCKDGASYPIHLSR